jgi:hypothetical protein
LPSWREATLTAKEVRVVDEFDEDDESVDITLRPAAEVAMRLIGLTAAVRRSMLELDPSGDAEGDRFDLAAWLREERLTPHLTADERKMVETRLGGLDPDEAGDAGWRIEAVAVLAWAAGLIDERPRYDLPAPPAELLALVPEPWDKAQPFRQAIELRPEDEIAWAREEAELWRWRGEVETEEGAGGASPAEIRQLIRQVAADSARTGLFEKPVGNDFPVAKRPYRDLGSDERELLTDLASERLRALNWLCGFGEDWDDTPLDV